ncbi:MAG: hypothetical protein RIS33_1316, partial [Actinomycetota bacterium]
MRRNHSRFIAVTWAVLTVAACSGSDSPGDSLDFDPAFSTGSALDDIVGAIAIQEDGQILVGGGFTTPSRSLARFAPDGTPDDAFNSNVAEVIDKAVYSVA